MALDKITTGIINDDAVTSAKIPADAVGTTEIANDASISTSGNIATTGSGTLTVAGTSTFTGGITEKSGTATATGTTITVDLDTGNFFIVDLEGVSGNVVTFTISNINATANQVSNFVLKIIQGTSTTTRNITWATVVSNGTNIDWAGGTGPDITTGADKVDILAFTSYDNGTTWYGAIVGQDFS